MLLSGTVGNDTLDGAAQGDIGAGFGGDDLLEGFGGGDTLTGMSNNDSILGGEGDDLLYGDAGIGLPVSFVVGDEAGETEPGSEPVHVEVTISEVSVDGRTALQVTLKVVGPTPETTADLRGFFFNLDAAFDSLIGTLSVTGTDVTDQAFDTDGDADEEEIDNLGGGANITPYDFQAGVEIGTSGISGDDIPQTTFVIKSSTANLTLSALIGQEIGIRLDTVGPEGDREEGEGAKLIGVVPPIGGGVTDPGIPGNDTLYGNEGNDTVYGNDGNDSLGGGNDGDTMNGGNGADSVYGDAGNDTLLGGNGNDTLYGGDGGDSLDAGEGTDTLLGVDGHDTMDGGNGADVMYGLVGNDSLYGGLAGDFIEGGIDPDILDGGSGGFDNILSYSSSAAGVTVNLATNVNTGGDAQGDLVSNFVRVLGSQHGDHITAHSDTTTYIVAQDGNDTVIGGNATDIVYGNNGDDVILTGAGDDYVEDGAGHDSIDSGEGRDEIHSEDGNDTVLAGNSATIDLVRGGNGDDSIDGQNGTDILFGEADADTVSGGNGQDWVEGGEGDDSLLGGASPGGTLDFLIGGNGDDTLNGGEDNDVLFGDAGADRFVYQTGGDVDVIGGFNAGQGDSLLIAANVNGTGLTAYAGLVAEGRIVDTGPDTVIDLSPTAGDYTSFIQLVGVDPATLDAGNVTFA